MRRLTWVDCFSCALRVNTSRIDWLIDSCDESLEKIEQTYCCIIHWEENIAWVCPLMLDAMSMFILFSCNMDSNQSTLKHEKLIQRAFTWCGCVCVRVVWCDAKDAISIISTHLPLTSCPFLPSSGHSPFPEQKSLKLHERVHRSRAHFHFIKFNGIADGDEYGTWWRVATKN